MGESVFVGDERLLVRKEPVEPDDDGPIGAQLTVTARSTVDVAFRLVESIPADAALADVRLGSIDAASVAWERDEAGGGLVLTGRLAAGASVVARWTVDDDVDRPPDIYLDPPVIDRSRGVIEAAARLEEVGATIRRLETLLDEPGRAGEAARQRRSRSDGRESTGESDRPRAGSPAATASTSRSDPGAPTGPPSAPRAESPLVDALLEELASGRVSEDQRAALSRHLGGPIAGPETNGDERPASPLVSVLADLDAAVRSLETSLPAGPEPTAAGAAAEGRLDELASRLSALERRLDAVERAAGAAEATAKQHTSRVDEFEADVEAALRALRRDVDGLRAQRAQIAEALRPSEGTPLPE